MKVDEVTALRNRLGVEAAQNATLLARVKELEVMSEEVKVKRVRGPRRPKSPLELAAMVHAEASKGWTSEDYEVFARVCNALRNHRPTRGVGGVDGP